jgi:hypothetical protein
LKSKTKQGTSLKQAESRASFIQVSFLASARKQSQFYTGFFPGFRQKAEPVLYRFLSWLQAESRASFIQVSFLASFSMEAMCSFETSDFHQVAQNS